MTSFVSCTSGSENGKAADDTDRKELGATGDSLAALAQKTLLQNVTNAIREGGPAYAVEFCNTKAGLLTDSVGKAAGSSIHRVTDKPRNGANILAGTAETRLFGQIRDSLENNGTLLPHYLLEDEKGGIVYYKPIVLGMPACLQCHGSPGKDIEEATLQKIKEKYPNDAATGYSLGQLRGLWKISFPAGE